MTDDNVINFPPAPEKQDWLIGPFEEYRVIVCGREIPRLRGRRLEDGRVILTVDTRFMGEFSTDNDAQQAAWLIGQASAIWAGYPHLGADKKDMPFAPQVMRLDSLPEPE